MSSLKYGGKWLTGQAPASPVSRANGPPGVAARLPSGPMGAAGARCGPIAKCSTDEVRGSLGRVAVAAAEPGRGGSVAGGVRVHRLPPRSRPGCLSVTPDGARATTEGIDLRLPGRRSLGDDPPRTERGPRAPGGARRLPDPTRFLPRTRSFRLPRSPLAMSCWTRASSRCGVGSRGRTRFSRIRVALDSDVPGTARPPDVGVPPASIDGDLAVPFAGGTQAFPGRAMDGHRRLAGSRSA